MCVPQNSYVEVLKPSTSECNFIWKSTVEDVIKGDEVVIISSMCQLPWIIRSPDIWLNVIYGGVYEGVSGRE